MLLCCDNVDAVSTPVYTQNDVFAMEHHIHLQQACCSVCISATGEKVQESIILQEKLWLSREQDNTNAMHAVPQD